MTETAPRAAASYSKDYWDIVLSQMGKRPSVRIALVALVILYASAIFAPFLAGDRPFVLEATDAAGFRKAQKTLVPIAMGFRGLVSDGREGFQGGDDQTWEAALQAERDALAQRVETMQRQLEPGDAARLEALGEALDEAALGAREGRQEAALLAADTLVELAKAVRAEMSPAETGEAAVPGETVSLVPEVRYPVFDAISKPELYFMGLWALVLLWPLWNALVNRLVLGGDRERVREARRAKVLAVVLLPALPLPFWSSQESPFSTSPYKNGLTSGEITATRAVLPPIPFGLAEISDAEYLRPPTWHRSSQMDEDGRYVHATAGRMVDPHTGYEVPPIPVVTRYGEPERNAKIRHALGTDTLGRDMLARMIWGGRVSLTVGLVSTVFLVLIGTFFGALAGYYGGKTDMVISRIIEIFQCFPAFFLILIVVAFIGPSILNIMLVIGITRWPGVARLVRGEFLRLRNQDFVVASEALGVPQRRTIFRHVLPNALGPVLVAATFAVASGIITESALSFLGFGVQLPVPSWGSLLVESRSPEHWWIQIFPGVLIFATVLLYNLLGEGVRDALDPRLKT
jgi:peptide/nickel transport system permease protein